MSFQSEDVPSSIRLNVALGIIFSINSLARLARLAGLAGLA
jgi:hypothetical protein